MDSDYYDEERMNDEMNEALNYEEENDYYEYEDKIEGFLSLQDVEEIQERLSELTIEEFGQLNVGYPFNNIRFLGWSNFQNDYKKIYISAKDEFISENEFLLVGVKNTSILSLYIDRFSQNKLNVKFMGIKKNYKGEEYALLHIH